MAKAKKIMLIVASITMVLAVAMLVALNYFLPQIKYNNAVLLMQEEKYDAAVEAFSAVRYFKDSAQKIEDCNLNKSEEVYLDARSAERLMRYELAFTLYASIGDYKDSLTRKERMRTNMQNESLRNATRKSIVYFGVYEQDNNLENGKEPVKWYVINTKGTYLQLLAVNALDAKQYHNEYKSITWEKSTIRTWLNNEFYKTTFNNNEKGLIVQWWITSEERSGDSTTVQDNVFLLSVDDVNGYVSKSFRECIPTPYAIAQGVYQSPDGDQCRWILRTPGEFMFNVQCVYFDGSFFKRGNDVNYEKDGLRPSIWINKSLVNLE